MKLKKPLSVGLLAAMLATGCHTINDNDGGCHIYGTANPRFNGKKIYLVPLQGQVTAEQVDSFIVNNGQFEFHVAPGEMKIIRVDYHVRLGVEDLLVVAESGRIEVSIDSVSYGKGTPQNDSLQQWKEATKANKMANFHYIKLICDAESANQPKKAEQLKEQLDSIQRAYRRYSRQLAANMKEGIFHDFLKENFPTTTKRRTAEGTIEEVPFD